MLREVSGVSGEPEGPRIEDWGAGRREKRERKKPLATIALNIFLPFQGGLEHGGGAAHPALHVDGPGDSIELVGVGFHTTMRPDKKWTWQRAMATAPVTAPIDVPAPEIRKASAAPWLMPEYSMARTSGREAAPLL